MNSKEWRDYLAEFPGDDYGAEDARLTIIADLESAERRAEAVEAELAAAAQQIPIAGPLSQRVRMLREEHGRQIEALEAACRAVVPFLEEDMPNGPDSESCAAPEYRDAYRLILKALSPQAGQEEESREHPEKDIR